MISLRLFPCYDWVVPRFILEDTYNMKPELYGEQETYKVLWERVE